MKPYGLEPAQARIFYDVLSDTARMERAAAFQEHEDGTVYANGEGLAAVPIFSACAAHVSTAEQIGTAKAINLSCEMVRLASRRGASACRYGTMLRLPSRHACMTAGLTYFAKANTAILCTASVRPI